MNTNCIGSSSEKQYFSFLNCILNVYFSEIGLNPSQKDIIRALIGVSKGRIGFRCHLTTIASQLFKRDTLIEETSEREKNLFPYSSQFIKRKLESVQKFEGKKGLKLICWEPGKTNPGEKAQPSTFYLQIVADAQKILESIRYLPDFKTNPIPLSNETTTKFVKNLMEKAIPKDMPNEEEVKEEKKKRHLEEIKEYDDILEMMKDLDKLKNSYEHAYRMQRLWSFISKRLLKKISGFQDQNAHNSLYIVQNRNSTEEIRNTENEDLNYTVDDIIEQAQEECSRMLKSFISPKFADGEKSSNPTTHYTDSQTASGVQANFDPPHLSNDAKVGGSKINVSNKVNNELEKTHFLGPDLHKNAKNTRFKTLDEEEKKEIGGFLEPFFELGAVGMDLLCVGEKGSFNDSEKYLYREELSIEGLNLVLPEASALNKSKCSQVVVTPVFEEGTYVLKLDDVKKDKLPAFSQTPCLITETSSSNYQVWMILKSSLEERAFFRDHFIKLCDSDKGDAGFGGRLVGSLNKKRKEPFKVKMVQNTLKVVDVPFLLDAWLLNKQSMDAFIKERKKAISSCVPSSSSSSQKRYLPNWPSLQIELSRVDRVSDGKRKGEPDRSRAEICWVLKSLSRGYSEDEVVRKLAEITDKKKSERDREKYARLTVTSAVKYRNSKGISQKTIFEEAKN